MNSSSNQDNRLSLINNIKVSGFWNKIWDPENYNKNQNMTIKSKKDKLNIYVVGNYCGGQSAASWILGNIVDNLEDADVMLLTGGSDINPSLYKEEANPRTGFNFDRDLYELTFIKRAKELGIPIFGICRGAQLLCAIAGGKLVQDISHPSNHEIFFYDNETMCYTTSCHHQMEYPYNLKEKEDYYILGYSEGLSRRYQGSTTEDLVMPDKTKEGKIKEPEFVYYPKIKALGIQGHPEWMSTDSQLCKILRSCLHLLVNENLKIALDNNLNVHNLLLRYDEFYLTEEEKKKNKIITVPQNKNKRDIYVERVKSGTDKRDSSKQKQRLSSIL